MKPRPRSLLAVLLLAGWCGSCTTNRWAESLEVSLVNLRFTEVTPFETTADFFIRVQNQMPEPLTLEGAVHKIHLNGLLVGSGVSNEALELQRLSEGVQPVRVPLKNLSMARLVREIVEARRVDYRLESRLYARVGGRSGRVNVVRAGALDLRDFQPSPPAGAPPVAP